MTQNNTDYRLQEAQQIKARVLGSGQTMVTVSGEQLREESIPVPLLAEQATLVKRLDSACNLMCQLTVDSLSREIEVLRCAILRKAFAGEL